MYMALHIQDSETDELARELSAETGETITKAINQALKERLQRLKAPKDREEYVARVMDITRRVAELQVRDPRSVDEILGYDENGLPT
jgi:antitoxin VapB